LDRCSCNPSDTDDKTIRVNLGIDKFCTDTDLWVDKDDPHLESHKVHSESGKCMLENGRPVTSDMCKAVRGVRVDPEGIAHVLPRDDDDDDGDDWYTAGKPVPPIIGGKEKRRKKSKK
jgi:hypothetical protein